MYLTIWSRNHLSWLMTTAQPAKYSKPLQSAHCIHIQIIGGFIKQKHIGFFLKHTRKMHAVSLSAWQHGSFFLLIAAGEVEARNIGARVDLPLAELNDIQPIGDNLPYGLLWVEVVTAFDPRYASFTVSPILNVPESGFPSRLSYGKGWSSRAPFRPDYADNSPGWEGRMSCPP